MLNHTTKVNLAILAVVVLVGVKLSDLVIGALLDIEASRPDIRHLSLREFPPDYTRVVRPSVETIENAQGLESKPVSLRVDSDGFIRGGDRQEGPVDIVFIGGSTTETLYVQDDLRFPALVATLLEGASGEPVRTLNAGFSGNNAMHSFLVILGKVLPYQPRMVVVMETVNDLSLLSKSGSYWDAPSSRALVVASGESGISGLAAAGMKVKDLLFPNSWQILKPYVGSWFAPELVDEFADYREQVEVVPFSIAADQYRAALTSIVRTLHAWDIEPVLMTQFNRLQVDDEVVRRQSGMDQNDYLQFVEEYGRFNQIVRDVAKAERATLIDLEILVPHSSEYMVDAVHLNADGSRLVGNIVASEISSRFEGYRLRSHDVITPPR